VLRDLFTPFRTAHLGPGVLAWDGAAVPRLACGLYQEQAFDGMPVLGDLLEEAGCTDADILGHCRVKEEHWRGCWVLDLILSRS
jgi:hypothetical protein